MARSAIVVVASCAFAAAVATSAGAAGARAQDVPIAETAVVRAEETVQTRPRVALALGGGGARGLAHVGALRALEEAGIPVDAIAANSMGAVLGGIYASGRSARELEAIVRPLESASLFSGPRDRRLVPVGRREDRYGALAAVSFDWHEVRLPAGVFPDHRINRFLIENLAPAGYGAGGDFDRLPIPFRAVAADLATGELVVLSRGDLARAVRASMSIPLAFPPVEWEGRRLVDGLIVDNLPIDVAKSFGAALVVAVDVASPAPEPSDYESALGVASQVNDLLTRRRNRESRAEADVVIRPELGWHSSTDYSGFGSLIEKGYQATRAAIPLIRERLAAAGVSDLARRERASGGQRLGRAAIREVVVRGNLRIEDALIRDAFDVPVGPAFDMQKGLRAFDEVSATGLLERTWMALEPDGDGVRVALEVKEAPPNRVEVGAAYTEWERARGSIRIRNQNTVRFADQIELLLAGSDAESLARVSVSGERLFVPGAGYRLRAFSLTDKPRFFDSRGDEINRARFERLGLEFALRGTLVGSFDLEAGLRLGTVRTRPEPGIDLPAARDGVRGVFASLARDTLDRLRWPEHGASVALEAEWSPRALGGRHPNWRLEARSRLGGTLGSRSSFQLDGRVGLSGLDLPVYDWYRVGGLALLPGYRYDELKGPQTVAAAASLRYRAVGDLRLVARAGAGNVFGRTGDIRFRDARWGMAIGAMVPTRAGPVSLELGVHDGGAALLSFSAGWD